MADLEPSGESQIVLEINLAGERRWLIDGDAPLPSGGAVARVMWTGRESVMPDELSPDSQTAIVMPSPVIGDDRLFPVVVTVFVGVDALVTVVSDEPIPPPVVRALASRAARELIEQLGDDAVASDGFSGVAGAASGIRYAALDSLKARLSAIEQSVRDALSDEHVTEEDYVALREYPQQLATVEQHANAIYGAEWESLIAPPSGRFGSIIPPPVTPDFYAKHVSELEQEARQAVATLSGLISSQQVVIVQRQRLEVERLQRVVTLVGAAVLVPGLIAAVFGANVNVPGENTTGGFWGMLVLMAAGGLGSYCVLRSAEMGGLVRALARLRLGERSWVALLGALSILLGAVAIVILLGA